MKPLSIQNFPNAIVHVDGDAFFASCEQALDPSLKGKVVITGKERGIVSAVSYEGKRLGITRAMTLGEVLKICPQAVILPSNYEAYSLFSMRMYEIVRRYTSDVEEYSIDECFADITGLRRPLKMNYEQIASSIKNDLETELGMTFSVGLAPTKVLAKVGSKFEKPNGFTSIPAHRAHIFLSKTAVGSVWGIGPQTASFLNKFGIKTAYDFAVRGEDWVKQNLSKPFQEIHYELRGIKIYEIDTKQKSTYASISKTKTFTPASNNRAFIFSQLSKNIENACIKLRRYNLRTKKASFFLKTNDFKYTVIEVELMNAVNTPKSLVGLAEEKFEELFQKNILYRGSGVVLLELSSGLTQNDLFGERAVVEKYEMVYKAIDEIAEKFGKHSVFLGSSFFAVTGKKFVNKRNVRADRQVSELLKGESLRMHLNIPIIGSVE